jgi:hypothetical protein
MSELKVNKVTPRSGTTVTLGDSGDTITIPSGATLDVNGIDFPTADGTAGQFLQTDGSGVLSFSSPSAGITEADQWRLTADLTGTNAVISSNLERADTAGQGTLGTGMTESSGVFTFPSTGYWFVQFTGFFSNESGADNVQVIIEATINNSTYAELTQSQESSGGVSSNQSGQLYVCTIVDVTSTSNVKVRFKTSSFSAASSLRGNTDQTTTGFTFIRLGNT